MRLTRREFLKAAVGAASVSRMPAAFAPVRGGTGRVITWPVYVLADELYNPYFSRDFLRSVKAQERRLMPLEQLQAFLDRETAINERPASLVVAGITPGHLRHLISQYNAQGIPISYAMTFDEARASLGQKTSNDLYSEFRPNFLYVNDESNIADAISMSKALGLYGIILNDGRSLQVSHSKDVIGSQKLNAKSRPGLVVKAIMYHSTVYPGTPAYLWRQQLQYLAENGYTAVSTQELLDLAMHNAYFPDPAIAITIDDIGNNGAYKDIKNNVFPMLHEFGFKFDAGIVPRPQKGSLPNTYNGQNYSWEELNAWADEGFMYPVSHTTWHADLTTLQGSDLTYQLRGSKEIIEDKMRRPVDILVLPGGSDNTRVLDAVQAAGYKTAMDVHGPGGFYSGCSLRKIYRISPAYRTLEQFIGFLKC